MNRLWLCPLTVLGIGAMVPGAIAVDHPIVTPSQAATPTVKMPQKTAPTTSTPRLAEIITEPVPADVPPTHWAYTAVDNLVTVYGCLSGYPDGTFRGDNPVSRYEFAAALNTCLDSFLQQVEAERQVDLSEVLAEMLELSEELDELSREAE